MNLALLISEYYACSVCVGIENVGPVAALEIMKEFPGDGIESLAKFRTWWDEAHKQVGYAILKFVFLTFLTLIF